MTFLWPGMLWAMLAVPAMAAGYLYLLRRRKRSAIDYSSLRLVREALGPRQRLRRHLPPALLMLAIAAALFAAARPVATVTLPSDQQTILLAMDVSLSMRAADVEPTRMAASQAAAKSFVQALPAHLKVGIVSFAGTASLVHPPTRGREELIAAIDAFEMQRGTAIGSALILSLATLFPDAGIDLESKVFDGRLARDDRSNGASDRAPAAKSERFTPVAPGSYRSAAIVLLTDGRTTTGPDPLMAARMAAERGVRVFTVGFGTAQGASVGFEGYSIFMRFDEEALKAIAELTKGQYFHAGTEADLRRVYEDLTTRLALETSRTEVSALFSAAAALLALAAAALSFAWFRRPG